MLKKFKKQMKNEKGLTLIELLAVIVILAIVAAIAVPAIGNVIQNSKDKAILADASNILSGAKIAMVDGACTSDTECKGSELNDFVEGLNLTDTNANAKRNATTGAWSIMYTDLGNIKKDKFKTNIASNETTEANLNVLMGNK